MKTRTLIFCAIALVVSGCAKVWVKDGASTDDFNKDKYDCMQQAQHQVSTVAVGKYSGYGISGQETNIALFNGCMNSRGWTLNEKQSQDMTNAERKEAIDQEKARITSLSDLICNDPKFAPIFSKSACKTSDITFEQLADKTKITSGQKVLISPLLKAIKDIFAQENAAMRKFFGEKGAKIATYDETVYIPKLEKLYLELYNGKITWGEFNKLRKDNFEDRSKFKSNLK